MISGWCCHVVVDRSQEVGVEEFGCHSIQLTAERKFEWLRSENGHATVWILVTVIVVVHLLRQSPWRLKRSKVSTEEIQSNWIFIRVTFKAVICLHSQIGSVSLAETSGSRNFRVSEWRSYRTSGFYDIRVCELWMIKSDQKNRIRFRQISLTIPIAVGCRHIVERWTSALVCSLATVQNCQERDQKYVEQHFWIHQIFSVFPTRIKSGK